MHQKHVKQTNLFLARSSSIRFLSASLPRNLNHSSPQVLPLPSNNTQPLDLLRLYFPLLQCTSLLSCMHEPPPPFPPTFSFLLPPLLLPSSFPAFTKPLPCTNIFFLIFSSPISLSLPKAPKWVSYFHDKLSSSYQLKAIEICLRLHRTVLMGYSPSPFITTLVWTLVAPLRSMAPAF